MLRRVRPAPRALILPSGLSGALGSTAASAPLRPVAPALPSARPDAVGGSRVAATLASGPAAADAVTRLSGADGSRDGSGGASCPQWGRRALRWAPAGAWLPSGRGGSGGSGPRAPGAASPAAAPLQLPRRRGLATVAADVDSSDVVAAAIERRASVIEARHAQLSAEVDSGALSPDAAGRAGRELARLAPAVELLAARSRLRAGLAEADKILSDPREEADVQAMAAEERVALLAELSAGEGALRDALAPRDEADERGVILEVRAGAGGDEASLFAAELLLMYERLAARAGWAFEVLERAPSDVAGGYKEASASISGSGAFGRLKFESGVHRVQRVPATEAAGRIHTSTASVAVLAQAEEVDVQIRPDDVRVDTYRSSGAGGQHVNTTDSAVRLTHLPTNTVVCCQDERSQHKNRARAFKVLRARLYEAQRARVEAERARDRKAQVGTGGRSERVRTYNYPQARVTDHRVAVSRPIAGVLLGAGPLDEIMDALGAQDRAAQLAAME